MKKYEINSFCELIMVFVMFGQIGRIIKTASTMSLGVYFGGNILYGWIAIAFSVLVLGLTLAALISRNPYVLTTLFGMTILRTFVEFPFGSDVSYFYIVGMNAVSLLHDSIPICLGLCFRPGWKSFLNSFK